MKNLRRVTLPGELQTGRFLPKIIANEWKNIYAGEKSCNSEEILAWTTGCCVYQNQIKFVVLSEKTIATYGLKGEAKLPT